MVNFLWARRHRTAERLWLLAGPAHSCTGGSCSAESPGFDHGGGDAMRRCINALFAISVNSPSMSMVNFPCCVGVVLNSGARGVRRTVTPQPMRAAVVMEAGADAYLCRADKSGQTRSQARRDAGWLQR